MRRVPLTARTAGVFVLVIAFSGQVRAQGEEGEMKIGVVDIVRVFDDYAKSDDLEKDLMEELEAFNNEMKFLKDDLDKLEAFIEQLSGESELRVEKVSEYAMKKQVYQARGGAEQKRWLIKQSKLLMELYGDIVGAVGEYAKAEGYTLVLKADSGSVRGESPDEVQLRIAIRPVLYYSSMHDLTDDIIKVLNENYEAEKKAAAEKAIPRDPSENPEETQETTSAIDAE
jgi:Skp family chaperone for outer membrane proteins